ncbi:MAG: SDR family oxidoreductase [Methanoregulaceae archaeon]|nr:SDR family oxidoreductase [Methanoregulaceae archaeon]
MSAPVILVTGSTDGIGKATAIELARAGAEVIIHGRKRSKGLAVLAEVSKAGGDKPGLIVADYSETGQVRAMAREVVSGYTKLDVLVNNAGTYQKTRKLTKEGVEMTFAVNYLAPFLLTNLLLPLIRRSSPSRIVTVGSSAHEDVHGIDWDDLVARERYDPWEAYAFSKFADIVFTYALARRLSGTRVTANCLHPGVVETKVLWSSYPGYNGITPLEGAETSVYLALSPEVSGVSGKYFDKRRPVQSSDLTYDEEIQERLWNLAGQLTGFRGD